MDGNNNITESAPPQTEQQINGGETATLNGGMKSNNNASQQVEIRSDVKKILSS